MKKCSCNPSNKRKSKRPLGRLLCSALDRESETEGRERAVGPLFLLGFYLLNDPVGLITLLAKCIELHINLLKLKKT